MRQRQPLYRNVFLSFLLIFLYTSASSQTIKGKVYDPATSEPLVGANVMLAHTHFVSVVQLDGSFIFRHVPRQIRDRSLYHRLRTLRTADCRSLRKK
ncbi:hypothetical protein ACQ86N_30945 [Puia sp. P3]|uniref:hypothetical protein n=1 Tax=Puia sp. P3 TaxID=3423952 RepID=UPI003D673029